MKLGIMQPYFLPYIGYFQLMSAVDKFVILDDVNYIKGGWINRNRILVNGQPKWLTLPLSKPSPNRLISDISVSSDNKWKQNILNACKAAYRRAEYRNQGMNILEEILDFESSNASAFITNALQSVSQKLGISAQIAPTSSTYPKERKTGDTRVLDICRRENASHYVNLPGGRNLYNASDFAAKGVSLHFLVPTLHPYKQGCQSVFTPALSILDVLMWNSVRTATTLLQDYTLDHAGIE